MNIIEPNAGDKPWNQIPLYSSFNDIGTEVETARGGQLSLIANLNLKATIAYVDSQIATGGVDLSTFSKPNDIITSSQDGAEFSSQPNTTMEIHKQFFFDGGIQ